MGGDDRGHVALDGIAESVEEIVALFPADRGLDLRVGGLHIGFVVALFSHTENIAQTTASGKAKPWSIRLSSAARHLSQMDQDESLRTAEPEW